MIQFRDLAFEKSATSLADCPRDPSPEVAVSGRSNVGKSSLLNCLAGRRGLAKVSARPGKTRSLNFFRLSPTARLVDLPGYGFARVSPAEQQRWRRFMEEYLEGREQLAGLVQLVDCRHAPTEQDRQMVDWLRHRELPFLLVLTKADKIGRGARGKAAATARKALSLAGDSPLCFFSSATGEGRKELISWILAALRDEGPSARR
jgi:GTP-binding protein